MKTFSVGEVQKNFAGVLRNINAGEEITITKRGKPVAKISAFGPKQRIAWPDFYEEALDLKGKRLSDIVIDTRKDRF
jgi:antitoxin (DNA-binding transcriptional repressor) of toxin-antitoxin stability system